MASPYQLSGEVLGHRGNVAKLNAVVSSTEQVLDQGGVVDRQKKKGGGSARFHHSARCASKWRRQISRSCA